MLLAEFEKVKEKSAIEDEETHAGKHNIHSLASRSRRAIDAEKFRITTNRKNAANARH